MKKITFVIADLTYVGGIERVNSLLANRLSKEGYEVEIISLYNTNGQVNYPLNEMVSLEYINNKKYSGAPGSISRFLSHIKSSFKIFKALKESKPSLVVINTFPMAFLCVPYILAGGRGVVIEHVHYHYYGKMIRRIRNVIYKWFEKIICINDSDYLFFSKKILNVIKIPNPSSFVSEGEFQPDINKIIAVGRLEYQKGFDRLIDAFNIVDKDLPGWELHIYGVGSLKEQLERQISTYSLSNIKLMGSVNDLHDRYCNYSIFAFSSRFEGFGMVLLEAMECGLPSISFDCPTGPAEILDNGRYGILVENNNIKEYAEKLASLMMDVNMRSQLSVRSKERAKDFSMDIVIQQWITLIEQS